MFSLQLFAAQSVDALWWQRMRENPNAPLSTSELLGIVGVVVALGLTWWLAIQLHQHWQRRLFQSPSGLFVELCHAHQLSWRQRQLLWRIAAAVRLEQPAQLFLRPELYWPPHVPPRLVGRQRELVKLHARIFGVKDAAMQDQQQSPAALS
jgi:hypothetical protein